jgi:hypothetical protein
VDERANAHVARALRPRALMKAAVATCAAALLFGGPAAAGPVPSATGAYGAVPARAAAVTFTASELLGRPTASSVALNVVPAQAIDAYVQYGTSAAKYTARTPAVSTAAGVPLVTTVSGLKANTKYFYRLRYRAQGSGAYLARPRQSFVTQRAKGASFSFAVQADPHLGDTNTDTALYKVEMGNVAADHPDFLVDLGDTFMTEKFNAKTEDAGEDYLAHREYFDIAGASSPVFLATGNHEGELGWLRDGTAGSLAARCMKARQTYYACPVPGGFYSGSSMAEPVTGVRDGYYAWTWGDGLFIVLDPFWYTMKKPSSGWDWTLGKAQYDWLKATLTKSTAKYTFVFTHHLVGGAVSEKGAEARGGAEAAPFYEWGGKNADGSDGFAVQRPGWGEPIHELLADKGRVIVFHGHDHLFVKQDLDGVVYQETPRPNLRKYVDNGDASKYGYLSGTALPNSGHLRVSVTAGKVTVDYVRAYLPGDGTNREISYSYTVSGG